MIRYALDAAPADGIFRIRYDGVIDHGLSDQKEEYTRGFRESRGILGPQGVYQVAGIGCIDCKGKLTDHMLERLAGIHARRPEFASRPDTVWDILREGSKRARAVAQATMDEVRTAMKIDYRTT